MKGLYLSLFLSLLLLGCSGSRNITHDASGEKINTWVPVPRGSSCFRKKLDIKDCISKANNGDTDAQITLAVTYQHGRGVSQDNAKALFWFRKGAEQGHAVAQNDLGWGFYKGTFVAQDYKQAVFWFKKAANQGYHNAQTNLGSMINGGEGIENDFAIGHMLQFIATTGGGQFPAYDLATSSQSNCYQNSWGVKNCQEEAENGDAKAQYVLAIIYHDGLGITKDLKKAVKWFKKSAEQGNAVSQTRLGKKYEDGSGVKRDYGESLRWYRKAAEQGLGLAQHSLGKMYENGKGVLKDDVKAFMFYSVAAKNGHEFARKSLGEIWNQLTPVQLEEAKTLIKKWDEAHLASRVN